MIIDIPVGTGLTIVIGIIILLVLMSAAPEGTGSAIAGVFLALITIVPVIYLGYLWFELFETNWKLAVLVLGGFIGVGGSAAYTFTVRHTKVDKDITRFRIEETYNTKNK